MFDSFCFWCHPTWYFHFRFISFPLIVSLFHFLPFGLGCLHIITQYQGSIIRLTFDGFNPAIKVKLIKKEWMSSMTATVQYQMRSLSLMTCALSFTGIKKSSMYNYSRKSYNDYKYSQLRRPTYLYALVQVKLAGNEVGHILDQAALVCIKYEPTFLGVIQRRGVEPKPNTDINHGYPASCSARACATWVDDVIWACS